MLKYIVRRFLRSLVTLAIVFVAVFMLLRFMPLNGYFPQEMIKETDEATRMAYLRNLGLLDHPLVQLGRFVKNLFQGDLGRSITVYPQVPIATLMAEKIPTTAFLGFWSMLLGIVAGLSGLFAAPGALTSTFIIRYNTRPPIKGRMYIPK